MASRYFPDRVVLVRPMVGAFWVTGWVLVRGSWEGGRAWGVTGFLDDEAGADVLRAVVDVECGVCAGCECCWGLRERGGCEEERGQEGWEFHGWCSGW
jgi:hypothetical protein